MRTSVVVAAILTAAIAPAAFADYTLTILTPPPVGIDVGQPTTNIADAAFNGNQAGQAQVNGQLHAYYWTGTAPGTDYNGSYDSSNIYAVSSTQAAGYVITAGAVTAAAWSLGNPTPQLLPTSNMTDSYTSTEATAISGSTIAGFGTANSDNQNHALVWTSPTAAPTDLHTTTTGFATTYDSSNALGIAGNLVVGYATPTASGINHAILWNLTTSTFADLNNPGLQNSQAEAISGNQIVGYGLTDQGDNSHDQALLWTLSGDSPSAYTVLVNPAGYDDSEAAATNGSLIVGIAATDTDNDNPQAVVWTSPTSYELLPTPEGDFSEALGIDADGNIVGAIIDPTTGQTDAVLWSPASPVPEPASLILLLPAAVLFCRRKSSSR